MLLRTTVAAVVITVAVFGATVFGFGELGRNGLRAWKKGLPASRRPRDGSPPRRPFLALKDHYQSVPPFYFRCQGRIMSTAA